MNNKEIQWIDQYVIRQSRKELRKKSEQRRKIKILLRH